MESEVKVIRKINPKHKSNILSKITFCWTLPLFIKGFKKELVEDDLYEVLPEYDSTVLGDEMEHKWNQSRFKRKYSILLILWNSIGKYYFLLGLTKILTIVLNVLRPIIIGKIVSYFVPGQSELTKQDAYFYGFVLIGFSIIDSFYRQNYSLLADSLAIRFRTSICSLIYRKSLNLSAEHLQVVPFGKVATLMTRDVNVLEAFLYIFNDAWTGLISTIIICYNIYKRIGSAVYVIIAGFIIYVPIIVIISIKIASLKKASSEKTDERIDVLQEVLCKIRSTKMYVWEKFIEKNIAGARSKEMAILLQMSLVFFILLLTTTLLQHVTFNLVLMTCIWINQELTAETIYFVTSGFQSITFNLTISIPYAALFASQLYTALERFHLTLEQLEKNSKRIKPKARKTDKPKIEVKNVTFKMDGKTILENISFDINEGLTLVLGPASSGKSTLLMAFLKEYEIAEGTLITEGSISYVSKEPWLFPSTIKQNILFGAKYDEKRYRNIIKLCALEYDFNGFENGDNTIVADQGINLSKGQQSRICLARAIYRDCDIYLFDDCLSNLDPLVADYVFKKCILTFLKKKLVILVTNNSHLIPYANNLIKLVNGKATFSKDKFPQTGEYLWPDYTFAAFKCAYQEDLEMDENIYVNSTFLKTHKSKNEIYKENNKSGSVPLNIYKQYVHLGGGKLFLLAIMCIFLLGQVSLSYKDKVISDWANLEEKITNYNKSVNTSNTLGELIKERSVIFYIYTVIITIIVCVILLRAYLLYMFSKNASVNLHKTMLKSVINATIKLFDTTFIGNIVNRFSKDLVAIDERIPFTLLHLSAIFFEIMGVLILISLVNPRFLIPTTVLIVILFFLKRGYLKTGRALKRLESSTKSPVIGYLNSTWKGLITIKLFGAETTLKTEFDRHQNLHCSAAYSNLSCMKAFIFAVDNLSSLFIAVIILNFLIFDETASAGEVGMAISQAFFFGGILYYGFHNWAEVETQMTSVERALEYTAVHQENKTGVVLKKWPRNGEIKFENVFLSLNNKSFVLQKINFIVEDKKKICIVGRTGAGKSSIISLIFRMYDFDGNITIGGVNIRTLSLDFLRSKLSVIPQDPLLLNGTIRYNIDPEEKYSDADIMKVLESVRLKQIFPSLDTEVIDINVNFEQKQLICLARVIMAKNQILLLDEITANGDADTESFIHDIIEEEFSSCTVIRITHKMKYAVKCDKVMVMNNGEIVEYDSPHNLLLNTNSLFREMVSKSGFEGNTFYK